ncbi:ABC transporter permease [Flavihumibacter petaseus]|uniref:ABC-2 type transporter transmembrane domain-containing protein n=1 Tax=Flavihumibacter petaseus NBRC 106054 TaxID=1220578 RepID=A0A0E9N5F3_9BACT|nr:ABC transporter permease [Flavihumibacter petaseus]GAO44906.1 hypothetical protein FPE01S_04_01490 [Flavihumibacter petaseus NBRC 106054]
MNKILIIARREFLTRVQKKTFLLTTILLPVIIFGLYGLIIYFSIKGKDDLHIAIAGGNNALTGKLENNKSLRFSYLNEKDPAALQQLLKDKQYNGFILLPDSFKADAHDSLELVTLSSVGLMAKENIERRLNAGIEKIRMQRLLAPGVTLEAMDSARTEIPLRVTKAGKSDSTGFAYGLGFFCGILIYMILFIYGAMVMRGVMEEKTSRIAEVIVSSVRPFQLMMGKIFGIGAVGLVQFLIWIALVIGLQLLLPLIFPGMGDQVAAQAPGVPGAMTGSSPMVNAMKQLSQYMGDANMPLILLCFILYFLGGYLIYSSLFAAVGSAVNEDPQDAQQLMLPITMPIIFSFVIMTQALNNPDGGLALFGSLFPLSSPIVMMARLPYGVPAWQLLLSLAFLVLGFLGTTWLAGRIYRTAILMYGKKPTWKEMLRWAFRKG